MSNVSHDSETAAQGQQVLTAVAFIWRDNQAGQHEVFLPKRAATKKFLPNVYEMPGGHIDFGEEMEDGLRREIMEELKVSVRLGDPFACFTYTNEVKGSHSIEVVYFAQFIDDESAIQLDPEDHSEYGWFTREYLVANRTNMREGDTGKDKEYPILLKGFDILAGTKLDTAIE